MPQEARLPSADRSPLDAPQREKQDHASDCFRKRVARFRAVPDGFDYFPAGLWTAEPLTPRGPVPYTRFTGAIANHGIHCRWFATVSGAQQVF